MKKRKLTSTSVICLIENNIRRLEEWMKRKDSKCPHLLKILTSLDGIIEDLEAMKDE